MCIVESMWNKTFSKRSINNIKLSQFHLLYCRFLLLTIFMFQCLRSIVILHNSSNLQHCYHTKLNWIYYRTYIVYTHICDGNLSYFDERLGFGFFVVSFVYKVIIWIYYTPYTHVKQAPTTTTYIKNNFQLLTVFYDPLQ